MNSKIIKYFPPRKQIYDLVESVYDMLFFEDNSIEKTQKHIAEYVKAQTAFRPYFKETEAVINQLPQIRIDLLQDAEFFNNSDPAAENIEEVIITYPGFFALYCYRIAHAFYEEKIPIIPRMITEYAHSKTGIDIHPGASIQVPFFIDHGTGIVIGQTTHIGKQVKMYQGVTLGALSVSKDKAAEKRHPTIEDHVVLYAGSCILGGNTVIGKNTIIGGNSFVTKSVAPNSVVYHKSETRLSSVDFNQIEYFI